MSGKHGTILVRALHSSTSVHVRSVFSTSVLGSDDMRRKFTLGSYFPEYTRMTLHVKGLFCDEIEYDRRIEWNAISSGRKRHTDKAGNTIATQLIIIIIRGHAIRVVWCMTTRDQKQPNLNNNNVTFGSSNSSKREHSTFVSFKQVCNYRNLEVNKRFLCFSPRPAQCPVWHSTPFVR